MDNETETEIRILRRSKSIAEDPVAGARKRDQETGRQEALKYAQEALLTVVRKMRTSGDEAIVMKACVEVMNRAWGKPVPTTPEDPKLANKSILDILEAVSITHAKVEHSERVKALEAQPVHPAAKPDLVSDYELIESDDDSPR